jgi:4'-phosphopantetheinyl transferase EntD
VIEHILPGPVASAEAFDDPPDAQLYPEEERVLVRAVDKRRREFRTVRHCARVALRDLGLPAAPVLPGAHREPLWPAGVVGSMTHCAGYRAAALALRSEMLTIGIDAEPHEPLPPDVLESVADDQERAGLDGLGASACWDRILFCAKETVYKAWFPLTGGWLGFEDASVTISPPPPGAAAFPAGAFSARLLVPGPSLNGAALTRFDGRWLVGRDLVITAIALPAIDFR